MLCWWKKKFITGRFYLHERPGKKSKTRADKLPERGTARQCGKDALPPVTPVRADDGRNGILINQRLSREDIPVSGRVLITLNNGSLDREGDLGIRDDRGKEKGMGMPAGFAEDADDPE